MKLCREVDIFEGLLKRWLYWPENHKEWNTYQNLITGNFPNYSVNLQSCLISDINSRKKRVIINESFRKWVDLLLTVPQGSIHGLLFYIVFLCDLLYFEEYIQVASYADENTPYNTAFNIDNKSLESSFAQLFNWFCQSAVKANLDKCHLLLSTNQKKLVNTILAIANLRNYLNHHWHKFDIYVNKICLSETKCFCKNCVSWI